MGMWEIQLGRDWQKFDASVGKALVEACSRGASEYRFDHKGQPYVVDFKTMQQKNLKTGKTRPVRDTGRHAPPAARIHSDAPSSHGTYPSLPKPTGYHFAKPSAPAAPMPSAPAAPAKPEPAKPEPAKPAAEKKSRFGFKTGAAAGVVAATGGMVGAMVGTGMIDGQDISDFAADAGDAIAGAACDAGEAIVDAADDVADFVTG